MTEFTCAPHLFSTYIYCIVPSPNPTKIIKWREKKIWLALGLYRLAATASFSNNFTSALSLPFLSSSHSQSPQLALLINTCFRFMLKMAIGKDCTMFQQKCSWTNVTWAHTWRQWLSFLIPVVCRMVLLAWNISNTPCLCMYLTDRSSCLPSYIAVIPFLFSGYS